MNNILKEVQDWYAKERKCTVAEFDDYDLHVCRVLESYHLYKVENNVVLCDVMICCICNSEGHYSKLFNEVYCDECYDEKINES